MAMLAFPEAGLVQDDGVFVADDFRNCSPPEQAFDWTPAYDMDWPGAPNPITAPALPIPFTAGELAAFMLDGMGAGLQEYLGRRIGCPLDDEALKRFGKRGRLVREALRSAYALAEQAQSVVGKFDYKKQKRAYDKRSELESANEQAIRSEGVFEAGISGEEASQRRARAVSSTAKLRARVLKACAKSDATWIAWRAAMVRQLLQPKPQAMMPPSVAPLEEKSAPGDEPLQPVPAPKAETACAAPVVAESASGAPAKEPRLGTNGPAYGMCRGALIQAHESKWPTIRRDLQDAAKNGLSRARAGARGWHEANALAWARSRGKLKDTAKPADALTQGINIMASLPGRKITR